MESLKFKKSYQILVMTCTQLNTRIDIRYAFIEARYQCHFISLNIESLRTFLIFKANAKKKTSRNVFAEKKQQEVGIKRKKLLFHLLLLLPYSSVCAFPKLFFMNVDLAFMCFRYQKGEGGVLELRKGS